MSNLKKEYIGNAGGIPGLVIITIDSYGRASKVEIDDLVFNKTDKQFISDLFVAALNDAYAQLEEDYQTELVKNITGCNGEEPLPSYNLLDLIPPDDLKKN